MRRATPWIALALALALVASCGRYNFERRSDGLAGDGGPGDDAGDARSLPPGNVAFVTSTMQIPGMLGGLAGADALCTTRANDAGLPGSYVAWLSTPTVDARDRIAGSRGWWRADGVPIVDTISDLVANGTMYYPLDRDEYGQPVPNDPVGTATDGAGVYDGVDGCNGFTGTAFRVDGAFAGRASGKRWTWGVGFTLGCSQPLRMYCFGVGQTAPVVPPSAAGRRAFVTDATWTPAGGLAAADALCQSEATGAALSGTFQALLATTTASAISRFELGGPTWVRVDGVPIVNTAADLTTGNLSAALNRTPTTYTLINESAWLGASELTVAGTASTSCNDWNAGASTGSSVNTVNYGSVAFFTSSTSCATPSRLYCLEL